MRGDVGDCCEMEGPPRKQLSFARRQELVKRACGMAENVMTLTESGEERRFFMRIFDSLLER